LISQNQVWYWRNNLHPWKTESQSCWSSLAVFLSSGNQIHTTQKAHTICPSISFWMICEMPYSSIRTRTLISVVYHYYQAAIYLFMAFLKPGAWLICNVHPSEAVCAMVLEAKEEMQWEKGKRHQKPYKHFWIYFSPAWGYHVRAPIWKPVWIHTDWL
jgi:hypothetical protein